MKGRAVSTELEVTDYVPNERVRLVADSDGVVWDTVFAVTPQDHCTLLTMTIDVLRRVHTACQTKSKNAFSIRPVSPQIS